MSRRRPTGSLTALAIGLLVALCAWPAFVVVATLLGRLGGDAWQLDAWTLEPKRLMLARFLDDWLASAPWSVAVGVLAAIDHALLTRFAPTAIVAGILLPFAGVLLALVIWPVPMDALPTLLGTGMALAILYRVLDLVGRRLR